MANDPVKITALTALTAAASDDELAIVDTSAGETKRITVENLMSAGVTNAAAMNVVPKSNGTNLVASGFTDDGSNIRATTDGDGLSALIAGANKVQVDGQGAGNDITLQSPTGTVNIAAPSVTVAFDTTYFTLDAETHLIELEGGANETKIVIDDEAQSIEIAGQIIKLTGLPIADPHVAGALYNDAGTLKVSAG